MTESIISKLRNLTSFDEVPDDDLHWFANNSSVQIYKLDDVIYKPGDEVHDMMIVLKGGINLRFKRGNEYADIGTFVAGEITGRMPFSRMQSPSAYLTTIEETHILRFHESLFPELSKRYKLIEVFVHSLLDRVRRFTTQQQQNEKLMALGKLSAGLAHELNNPASAMVRSATALRKNLKAKPDKFKAVMNIRLTNEEVDTVNELVFRKAAEGSSNNQSLMERTALEDELADWMEDNGVENGFEYAETFAEYCFKTDDLDFIKDNVRDESLSAILGWVEDVLTTDKMVEEIEDSARRISDLVSSVKTYSHMDRGTEKEAVDLKKMLKSTKTMLNHKSKAKQVDISISVQEHMPEFCGFVSELNQVWTNLLDNAIDAVDEHGKIEVEATAQNGKLIMLFKDNGKGIPDEVKNQIFDPFFTTKDVGQGTGLGLDVAHKIIEKHKGTITVDSEPGNTVFKLTFPFS